MIVTVLPCDGIVPGHDEVLAGDRRDPGDEVEEVGVRLQVQLQPLARGQPAARIATVRHRRRSRRLRSGRSVARAVRGAAIAANNSNATSLPRIPDRSKGGTRANRAGARVIAVRQRPDLPIWRPPRRPSACFGGVQSRRVTRALPAPIRRALWGLAWGITAVLATVVAMRLAWHDGLWLFLLFNVITPYLYLPHGRSQRAPRSPGAGA